MRVARQIRQHRFWSGERFLGIYDPIDFAQRPQERTKGCAIDELGVIAEELQLPGIVQFGEPFEHEAPEETG